MYINYLLFAYIYIYIEEYLLDSKVTDNRLRLLNIYESALLNDIEKTITQDIDRSMWKYGFHIFIEQLRNIHHKQTLSLSCQLAEFFNHAIGFYSNFVTLLTT